MVGVTKSRWLTAGLTTIMAAGLVVGSSAAAFAQDESLLPRSARPPRSPASSPI